MLRPFGMLTEDPAAAGGLLAWFEGADWLPGALFLGTFVTEDLSCVAGGLLAAEGRVPLWLATVACGSGIWVGDLGLYLIGWATARGLLRWGWARRRLAGLRGNSWSRAFADHGTRILFASRFVPGTRNICYLTAGAVGWPLPKFMAVMAVAVALWSPLLVGLSAASGEVVVELLAAWGAVAWLAVPLALLVAWLVIGTLPLLFTWRGRRLLWGRWLRLTRWEHWPPVLVFPPVALDLIRTALVHRTTAVFTACNPGVPQGGLVGESKGDILDLFGDGGDSERVSIARYRRLPAGLPLTERVAAVAEFLAPGRAVLKPDQGERGAGVAVVQSVAEAEAWLGACPFDAMVQEFVEGEEFGVSWSRNPDTGRGEIHSIAHKVLPAVVGDGQRSLEDLILAGERTVAMARHHLARQAGRLEWVPAAGERVSLGDLGTHARGATFYDARGLATPELHEAFEAFMAGAPLLDFGRFDLRVPDADHLRAGRGLRILEFNGVTGEAAHVYQPGYPWHRGARDMIAHLRRASAIGAANRARGIRQPAPLTELVEVLWTAWRRPVFEAPTALQPIAVADGFPGSEGSVDGAARSSPPDRPRSEPVGALTMSPKISLAAWVARLVVAVILLQTLFFKFTAAPESVHIFETVGMEPWGRIATGIAELIASGLLLVPASRFAVLGASLALGVISGALFFHLTRLGLEVQGDGGQLFVMACVVFVGAAFVLWAHRRGFREWFSRGRARSVSG